MPSLNFFHSKTYKSGDVISTTGQSIEFKSRFELNSSTVHGLDKTYRNNQTNEELLLSLYHHEMAPSFDKVSFVSDLRRIGFKKKI